MAKTLQLASVNRMPGMFKRFSRLLPRLFRRLSLPFTFGPSIRVFTRRPSDSHAPSSGGSSHRVEPSTINDRPINWQLSRQRVPPLVFIHQHFQTISVFCNKHLKRGMIVATLHFSWLMQPPFTLNRVFAQYLLDVKSNGRTKAICGP